MVIGSYARLNNRCWLTVCSLGSPKTCREAPGAPVPRFIGYSVRRR